MDLAALEALFTPAGQQALQSAQELQPREADYLKHFQALSRRYPADLARPALEIAILRREAAGKFPVLMAAQMYLTRQALEQATSYEIAANRAERYRLSLQPDHIVDLGCSIGSDTLALAGAAPTLGLDRDRLRLRMAQANLEAFSTLPESAVKLHPASFAQADLTEPLPVARRDTTALFFDPARRDDQRRIFSVQDYQPPLAVVKTWLPHFTALGVKLSPGVDLAELADYPAEIEFISLNGELKECVLWFGSLRNTARRATLLPSRAQMTSDEPFSSQQPPAQLSAPQSFLYEPDPAILRAGLVRSLAEQLQAAQLDPEIAYLTSGELKTTPFARAWVIEDWFPFQLKRLRAYLRQRGIGKLTVKKRGSPLEPEALIRDLRLQGDSERVLVLTHLNGEPIVLICLPPGNQ